MRRAIALNHIIPEEAPGEVRNPAEEEAGEIAANLPANEEIPPKRARLQGSEKLATLGLMSRVFGGMKKVVPSGNHTDREAVDTMQNIMPLIPTKILTNDKFTMTVLNSLDPDYDRIMTYVSNSVPVNAKTLAKIRVERILKIRRTNDWHYDFSKSSGLRMMLWHGNRNRALPLIFENGLELRRNLYRLEKKLPVNLLTRAIYFSDRALRSAAFCDINDETPKILFLCDVFLGRMANSRNVPDYKTRRTAPGGFHSVLVDGSVIPRAEGDEEIDGCIWPLGENFVRMGEAGRRNPALHNDYIIYDPQQAHPRYAIKWNWDYVE